MRNNARRTLWYLCCTLYTAAYVVKRVTREREPYSTWCECVSMYVCVCVFVCACVYVCACVCQCVRAFCAAPLFCIHLSRPAGWLQAVYTHTTYKLGTFVIPSAHTKSFARQNFLLHIFAYTISHPKAISVAQHVLREICVSGGSSTTVELKSKNKNSANGILMSVRNFKCKTCNPFHAIKLMTFFYFRNH